MSRRRSSCRKHGRRVAPGHVPRSGHAARTGQRASERANAREARRRPPRTARRRRARCAAASVNRGQPGSPLRDERDRAARAPRRRAPAAGRRRRSRRPARHRRQSKKNGTSTQCTRAAEVRRPPREAVEPGRRAPAGCGDAQREGAEHPVGDVPADDRRRAAPAHVARWRARYVVRSARPRRPDLAEQEARGHPARACPSRRRGSSRTRRRWRRARAACRRRCPRAIASTVRCGMSSPSITGPSGSPSSMKPRSRPSGCRPAPDR